MLGCEAEVCRTVFDFVVLGGGVNVSLPLAVVGPADYVNNCKANAILGLAPSTSSFSASVYSLFSQPSIFLDGVTTVALPTFSIVLTVPTYPLLVLGAASPTSLKDIPYTSVSLTAASIGGYAFTIDRVFVGSAVFNLSKGTTAVISTGLSSVLVPKSWGGSWNAVRSHHPPLLNLMLAELELFGD